MSRNPTFLTFPTFHIFPIPLILLFLLCTLACERSDSHQASDVHQASDAHPAEIQSGHLQLPAASDTPASTIPSHFITKSGNADFIALTVGSVGIFSGETRRLNGTLDLTGNLLEFSMQVRSLKTGIARRDRDMYAVLDADRFPQITFTGTFTPDFDPVLTDRQPVTATGIFALHGVEQELTVDGFLQRSGNSIKVEADFPIDLKDYGVYPPETLLVKINDQPEIHISAHLVPQLLANNR